MYDIDVRCSLKGYTASTIVKWHCLLPFTSPRFSAMSPKSQEMVVVQIVWVCIHMASIAAEVAQPPHIICMRWIWDAVWSTLVKWHRSLPFMLPRIRISAKSPKSWVLVVVLIVWVGIHIMAIYSCRRCTNTLFMYEMNVMNSLKGYSLSHSEVHRLPPYVA